MTLKDIDVALNTIRELARQYDAEAAAMAEKELYKSFLHSIAVSAGTPTILRDKAALVLSSERIEFSRYCA